MCGIVLWEFLVLLSHYLYAYQYCFVLILSYMVTSLFAFSKEKRAFFLFSLSLNLSISTLQKLNCKSKCLVILMCYALTENTLKVPTVYRP